MSILDQYIQRQEQEPVTALLNQGHKQLCPKCVGFQRHEITLDPNDLSLTLRCRVCSTSSVYVITKFGYVEKGLRRRLQEFAMQRATEEMLRFKTTK